MKEFSIIIVNFNTKELLRKCLESIKKLETGNWKLEIIIVDNGSTDRSVEMVETGYKDIKILRNITNSGFARAANQGIKKATGQYVLLLNPDIEVKPGALESLLNFVKKRSEVGIVGARLLNPDGSIQASVYHFPTIWRAVKEFWLGKKGAYDKYVPVGEKPIEVEAVTGAVMLIPKKTIEKIGLLDERYFMYFEDLDFCRRALKAGFRIFYYPQSAFMHHHGAAGKKIPDRAKKWLVESSKRYNGLLKYWVITFIIWSGQKIRKFF